MQMQMGMNAGPNMAFDAPKVYKQERVSLRLHNHDWALEFAEKKLLGEPIPEAQGVGCLVVLQLDDDDHHHREARVQVHQDLQEEVEQRWQGRQSLPRDDRLKFQCFSRITTFQLPFHVAHIVYPPS